MKKPSRQNLLPPAPDVAAGRKRLFPVDGWICIGLALVTLALYLPVLHHEFVNYDDQQYVTDNPRVQAGLTWHGLIWAFGFYAGNWHPLTWLSHMADCQIYGARAWGHHLTNALLHAASTVLLFLALNRMTRMKWRSAAVAALFGWHPLHVESVAWVAERKDVLCAFFWMLTMLAYAGYAERKSASRYFMTLGAFTLALMSKPMAVTLPFVLLLLDYWPLKRVASGEWQVKRIWQLVLEKIPFFILSAIACALTLRAQQLAIVSTAGLPLPQRFLHSLAAYNHYLTAMFFPNHLAVYYPYEFHLPATVFWLAGIVLAAVTWLAITNLRQRPYVAVGWAWYLGTLVPVIGLVQVGDQAWADRYTYLPLIGLFMAAVWGAAEIIRHRRILQILSAIVAIAMLAATSAQIRHWKSTRTLFEHAVQVTSRNSLALSLLADEFVREKNLDEAFSYCQKALGYNPKFPEAHFLLGHIYDQRGRLDDAVAEYQLALWYEPMQAQTHIFLAMVLAKQQKHDQAITHYLTALKLNPDSAVAENNLARIYHSQGKFNLAIKHYQAALEIDPKLALARNNLGILLIQQGDLAGGIVQLREAMRLNPASAETQLNLAFALNQRQQWTEAADLLSKNVRADLPDPKAHYEFAMALAHLKQTREAMSQYAAALLLQPDFSDALNGLAWIICTDTNPDLRNGTEAVKMATRACELTGNQDPKKLRTLAAAYAETGQFEQATKTLQAAMDLAAKSSRQELVSQCSLMLEQFKKSQPWREK